ncbi:Manganese-dependent ADP-ribose/CDP-alcohol diphosphatase [Rhynchospora pubera]|uniref:Manganese-dependent ADP-ribose/CDP-alcohol diphosphatase n=1 Tax=Rhynchospora pubera TaxID=906938 RepID=A0AAV8EZ00_9POAL|nr:Manganese-dependent ADP-ribose/CDP-alcohol diphosphatase [Rhynchospora pubera]KAJ4786635.1 Manganese-dependent ADP-ribose/CDP-alcohol diphosphatase [Rhynchospora pubera]
MAQFHMIGNHCLYNLPRTKLIPLLKIPSENLHVYDEFSPCPEYHFIVLDAYDFSALGWPGDHKVALEANQFLREKNPNSDKNSPNGLIGVERRFVLFNGAVAKEQLSWLEGTLQDCDQRNQNVVVCSHLPLDPRAAAPEALLWNYDEICDDYFLVTKIIHKFKCVKACFSGHDHKGGYCVELLMHMGSTTVALRLLLNALPEQTYMAMSMFIATGCLLLGLIRWHPLR